MILQNRTALPNGGVPGSINAAAIPVIFSELPRELAAALERAGSGGLTAAMYVAFAVLLHRQDDRVEICFSTGAGCGVRIDLSGDPIAGDVARQIRPISAPTDTWPAAFTFDGCGDDAAATHELDVRVYRRDNGIYLAWRFEPALLERATVVRLCAQYLILLRAILTDSDRTVSRLPLMSAQERLDVLALGRGSAGRYERDSTIEKSFSAQAARTPLAVAVRADDVSLSYAQLERRSNRLAHYIRSLGVRPGMPVGVAFDRSAQLPVALLAILKAGAAYVPLDRAYPGERIAFMLADGGVKFVIAQDELCDEWPHEAATVIRLDVCAEQIARSSDASLQIDTGPEALAYIMYTSGSTGRPKGVAIPHRGVLRLVRGADYITIASDDVFLQLAPLAFDASTFEIWAPLLNGAQLAIPRPGLLSVDDLGRAVEGFGVTSMWLTAPLFRRVVESKLPAFNGLRRVLTGGDVASPGHVRRFLETYPACRLANGYGPTENTTFSTWCELTPAEAVGTNVPIGRPIANSTAYVLDAHLEPVPVGAIGELCVGGDGVARGYLNLAEITAERFIPDPFSSSASGLLYRTGDRARLRADGILELHGRTDHQVKIRGFRIELGEVEAAFQALPSVADAAVVAVEEKPGEKILIAYVVLSRDARLGERDLRALVRTRLPNYMLPHHVTIVAELPLGRSGKVDRIALAQTAKTHGVEATRPAGIPVRAPSPPGTTSANAIEQLWRDVLGAHWEAQTDVNFFDAGGDSLRLLRLLELLNERFALSLDVLDLFEHTTIGAQAALIAGSSVGSCTPMTAL